MSILELEELYAQRCIGGDAGIHELLPTLRDFAARAESVVEFGSYTGNSTVALLCGLPRTMTSVDIAKRQANVDLEQIIPTEIEYRFLEADDRQIDIEPTDLLFIDTEHTYEQLHAELERHADKVKRWIVMHDTVTFGDQLNPAITEFLAAHPGWWEILRLENCNGLTVLERK